MGGGNAEWAVPGSNGSGINYGEVAGGYLSGGLAASAISSQIAQRQARAQAAQQAALLQQEQDRRTGLVTQLRDRYGIGTDPTAQASARTLADYLRDYYNSYLTNQLGQVDNQFAAATKTSRQNLARVGQLGSGLDTSTRATNLSDFIRARQDAISRAAQARDALSSDLTSQRLGLEGQINAGTLADPDFSSIAAQQSALIGQARSQIPANTIGNLFTTAGQTYQQGAMQGAYGNQGLAAFGFGPSGGGSSGGGRITGG